MKFGKSLSNQIEETLPEWRDKFLSYKDLKKRLKLLDHKDDVTPRPLKRHRMTSSSSYDYGMTKEEADFISLLQDELDKFNAFFVDNEEEYIIRIKELQDRFAKARAMNEELSEITREIVDFHGEMVLLENYSSLNYTGLVKILKKYDKRTGALIRLPFIQKVLQEPFFTTDLLFKLVKECERMLDMIFPANVPSIVAPSVGGEDPCVASTSATATATDVDNYLKFPKELAEIERMESMYMKSTISALRALKEIRSGSSTVSMFSLPPLQLTAGLEGDWKKIPVLEQVAK